MSASRDPAAAAQYDGVYNRVQDKELLEISDQRCCLSMHQPYASLLVAGIKRHEGRTWYTAHRGRLWIAATSKPADADEVKRVEAFYRRLYADPQLVLPEQYPTACLLGCVLVQVGCVVYKQYAGLCGNIISNSIGLYAARRLPQSASDGRIGQSVCVRVQRAARAAHSVSRAWRTQDM